MSDVTRILSQIESGDPSAADQLLPLVYDELRLVDVDQRQLFNSRGHFFAAAAEAMRRILVDTARRRKSMKRGGERQRVQLPETIAAALDEQFDLLALDEALNKLALEHPDKAKLVKLRYFAGCSLNETAEFLGLSRATAQRHWAFARAWLYGQLGPS